MFIFSNLAISADGKIATANRAFFPLGTSEDRRQMQVLRRRSDAVIMGAATLRTFKRPLRAAGAPRQPANIIVSSTLKGISPRWKFFTEPKIRRILFITGSLSAARRKAFEATSEVVELKAANRRNAVAVQIRAELARRGFKRLLVEGGGGLMWDFVSCNLIDEYHLTVTPRLLGGTTAPTLVDGPGFDPNDVVNLKLIDCRRVKDELYLVYRKSGRRGP